MKDYIISTQDEYDSIRDEKDIRIVIRNSDGLIKARGNSHIIALSGSHISAGDNVTVEASGDAEVALHDTAEATIHDKVRR